MLDSVADWINDRRDSLRDTITIDEWIDDAVDWVDETFEKTFEQIDEWLTWAVEDTLLEGLTTAEPPLMAVLFAVLATGLALRMAGIAVQPLHAMGFGGLAVVTVLLSGSWIGGVLGGVVAFALIVATLSLVTRRAGGLPLDALALAALTAITLAWSEPAVMAGMLAGLLAILLVTAVARAGGFTVGHFQVVVLGTLAVSAFFLEDPIFGAIAFAAVAWRVRSLAFGFVTLCGFLLIDVMGLWNQAMQTLSFVLVASFLAVAIGVPIGILATRSRLASTLVRPVLDFMQTMPALVYLVVVVGFFSVGVMPGVVATIIFAMPPAVRLTELGIRQVDREVVEAGEAFGTPPGKILTRIQIPLATPTIMAGVNQVIMLALSMVVLAALVGAAGLGGEVTRALAQLNTGSGFEAGLAVVVLAVFLDRVTASFGQRTSPDREREVARSPSADTDTEVADLDTVDA
jgi:ABC-type proline/glycine betaine transport system permease subunit